MFIARVVDMEKPPDYLIGDAQRHAPWEDMVIDLGLLQSKIVNIVHLVKLVKHKP